MISMADIYLSRHDLNWPLLTAFKTTIGVNPWVMHRETNAFGGDVGQLRPERWLERRFKCHEALFLCLRFGITWWVILAGLSPLYSTHSWVTRRTLEAFCSFNEAGSRFDDER
ncbi:hypothetical protein N7G274_003049 [Stereocaulon virgatum]|uniref:Uncharacterized protein n=1 Tax=Stereocaulon virgatum TaxID=373712 RepID=A0ABR4AHZ9_9LECA